MSVYDGRVRAIARDGLHPMELLHRFITSLIS